VSGAPLRVLWVASQLEPRWSGGIGRVVAGAAAALAAAGAEVHLAGRARHGAPGPIPGVRIHAWPGRLGKTGQIPRLLALQRRLRAQVVHFHSARPHGAPILALLALRAGRGRPRVVVSPYTGSRWDSGDRAARAALARADAVVTSARWSAERAVAAGAPRERVHVIPAGVDLPPDSALLSPAKRAPWAVALSRLAASKGIDVLLEAFDTAARGRPDWRLRIAGEGAEAEALRARGASLSCADRIEWLGPVHGPAKRALLAEAAVGVQPSRDDHFPGALLELQAWGAACVGSAVGGIPEILGRGEAGELVPPGDPAALARALGALMDDPARRARLATAGRRAAATRTWDAHAARLLTLYKGGRS